MTCAFLVLVTSQLCYRKHTQKTHVFHLFNSNSTVELRLVNLGSGSPIFIIQITKHDMAKLFPLKNVAKTFLSKSIVQTSLRSISTSDSKFQLAESKVIEVNKLWFVTSVLTCNRAF